MVTGGAGFIGSHLVDKLIELGHEVSIIDDMSGGKIENVNEKARLHVLDISRDYFDFHDIDYVFHLAAIPRVPYSVEYPKETHDANVTGTLNVLLAAEEARVKKVIFASSSSVYGDQELPLKETYRTMPKSPYALHKSMGEQYMTLFNDLFDVPTVSLRFFNVYGPRADPNSEYSLVVAKFLKYKRDQLKLPIYGDGKQTRDFTYVSDVVDACILAMEKNIRGEVINVCNGRGVSVLQVADWIGGEKDFQKKRVGDVLHTLGDNTKIKKLLDWEPKVKMEDGIKMM